MKDELPDELSADQIDQIGLAGKRGKYAKQYNSTILVQIDPDLVERFPNAKAVNDALRSIPSAKPGDTSGIEDVGQFYRDNEVL